MNEINKNQSLGGNLLIVVGTILDPQIISRQRPILIPSAILSQKIFELLPFFFRNRTAKMFFFFLGRKKNLVL